MDAISSFGSWVRRRRRLLDLTQVELAQHVHCSVVMIKKIEREERGASHQMAQQLARALVLPQSLIPDFVRAARFELAADCLPDPRHLVEVQHQPSTRLPATRLPVQPTPFIGREAALETLCTMVQTMRTRLITLIGPPGIGKTRLALAAAEQLQASFPGGVVFVDLAAITDEAAILSHIASAFGVAIEGEQPIVQHLDRSLHKQNTLVLIDNCEHLAQVAYIISDLLSHVMHLRIMATSREPLRLRAEQRFELSSMSVPPLQYGRNMLIHIQQYEAVQLFVDRARAVRHEFTLSDGNADLVAQICHILDGLPLAIELAAARIASLSLDTIVQALGTGHPGALLDMLNLSNVDQPSRHQTLRHAIAWSYQLMNTQAQVIFRALAIFQNGWTREAAQAIVVDSAGDQQLIVETLNELVHKNLIQIHPQSDKVIRYRMLVTLHDFGRELLHLHQEEQRYEALHTRYFYHFALGIQKQSDWQSRTCLQAIEADYENIRRALIYLRDHDDVRLLHMTSALAEFWCLRGMLAEGYAWIMEALQRLPTAHNDTTNHDQALAWMQAGDLCYHQSDMSATQYAYRRGLALLGSQDYALIAILHHRLGRSSPYQEALPLLEKSLEIYQVLDDRVRQAEVMGDMGNVARFQADYEQSIRFHIQAIMIYRDLGRYPIALADTLTALAQTLLQIGRIEEARNYQYESLTILRSIGSVQLQMAWALESMGCIASAQGEFAEARLLLAEGLDIFEHIGDRSGELWNCYDQGRVELRAGNLALSQQWLEQSLGKTIGSNNAFESVWIHTLLAEVTLRRNHIQAAKHHLGSAFAPGWTAHSASYALNTCVALAAQEHQYDHASVLLGAADAIRIAYRTPLPPADYDPYRQLMFLLQSMLSQEQYTQAYLRGQMLPVEEAIVQAKPLWI